MIGGITNCQGLNPTLQVCDVTVPLQSQPMVGNLYPTSFQSSDGTQYFPNQNGSLVFSDAGSILGWYNYQTRYSEASYTVTTSCDASPSVDVNQYSSSSIFWCGLYSSNSIAKFELAAGAMYFVYQLVDPVGSRSIGLTYSVAGLNGTTTLSTIDGMLVCGAFPLSTCTLTVPSGPTPSHVVYSSGACGTGLSNGWWSFPHSVENDVNYPSYWYGSSDWVTYYREFPQLVHNASDSHCGQAQGYLSTQSSICLSGLSSALQTSTKPYMGVLDILGRATVMNSAFSQVIVNPPVPVVSCGNDPSTLYVQFSSNYTQLSGSFTFREHFLINTAISTLRTAFCSASGAQLVVSGYNAGRYGSSVFTQYDALGSVWLSVNRTVASGDFAVVIPLNGSTICCGLSCVPIIPCQGLSLTTGYSVNGTDSGTGVTGNSYFYYDVIYNTTYVTDNHSYYSIFGYDLDHPSGKIALSLSCVSIIICVVLIVHLVVTFIRGRRYRTPAPRYGLI